MSLHLHIERVIVHGLPGGEAQRRQFAEALSGELTRLLGPTAGRTAAPARTAPAAATTGGAAGLARAVAGSVVATLSREIRR
ncbi:hypothetical protein K4L06_17325 [Lysobacter sp. BMK333-48F3]|uniref:hypothetical protein n=1 Tax=Lysobacter sp. BMK333-48F3 TaxID=2867962 RepID=UPI001C8B6026|nr:hypothetical protein [Lysobacter sp. BMK333-48F3]MBX9403073.1 hypothetical protein [Lysobacter sp. BMK333-48F3]